MAKVEVTSEIYNTGGTIYYAGFVNGEYVHILTDYKLSNSQAKRKLLDRYNKIYNKEEENAYGNQ